MAEVIGIVVLGFAAIGGACLLWFAWKDEE